MATPSLKIPVGVPLEPGQVLAALTPTAMSLVDAGGYGRVTPVVLALLFSSFGSPIPWFW